MQNSKKENGSDDMADREKVIKGLGELLENMQRMNQGFFCGVLSSAIELLKEQEAMKVTVRFNHTDNKCFDHYKCPSCGSTDIYYEQHYCDDCGKALDWSEIT